MFIPNKTFHAMRVVILGIIAVLLAVIAGQSVLYITKTNESQLTMDSLDVRVESLGKNVRYEFLDVYSNDDNMNAKIEQLQTTVNELQAKMDATYTLTQRLLQNECSPETAVYMVTKEMVAICRTMGTIP